MPSTAVGNDYVAPKFRRVGPSSFQLTNSVVVGCPLDDVFEYCRDTRFLDEISPPLLRFRPREQPDVDVGIAEATEIEYDMRLHGFPVRWRSKIPVFEPPHRFIDEQMNGPYLYWSHNHTFEPLDDRNTAISDVVDYTLPGWPLIARMAHILFVKRALTEIFSHRSLKYREILGEPAS